MPIEPEAEAPALVTIAIPTFCRLNYLKEAVASALAQTYGRIEVLIGDDGGTEAIQSWGQSLADSDPRVRFQSNPNRLGLAGNWNALADSALGEFMVIIGDDDRLLPDFVSRLVSFIQPGLRVAFSNHYLIDSDGVCMEAESRNLSSQYHRAELTEGEITNPAVCVWRNSVPISAALLRTRDVQRLRFKEDLNTPEIEFFARLAAENGRFAFTPEYLAEYRVHADSATASGLRSEELVKYLEQIIVPADVEPYKRAFMSSLLSDAVSRCLQFGDTARARQFLQNEYYPRFHFWSAPQNQPGRTVDPGGQNAKSNQRFNRQTWTPALTSYLQTFCALLPVSVGPAVFCSLRNIKSRFFEVS